MQVTINRVEGYSKEHWRGSSYYWILEYMKNPDVIYDVDTITSKVVDIDEEYLMSKDLEDLAYRAYYGDIL